MRCLHALCVLFLLGGCDCGEGSSRGEPCASDSECLSSEMCVDGRCAARRGMDAGPDGGLGLDAAAEDRDGATMDAAADLDGAVCATATATPGRLPVDVILVVDESASTGEEAAAIQANINTSLGAILEASGLDYRVILINAGVSGLCPQPPLGPPGDCAGSNPPRYHRIPHPVNNSDALTVLLWSYDEDGKVPNSCHRTAGTITAWRDLVRFDSLKVFIVFSDDDPTSFSRAAPPACPGRGPSTFGGCTNADCLSTTGAMTNCSTFCPNFGCPTFADRPADWGGADFPTELYALGPQRMVDGRMENPFGSPTNPRWIFHSIIGVQTQLEPSEPVTGRCATCAFSGNTAENAGVTYQQLSRLTGGVRFPSCDTDYSPVFGRISSDIAPLACELTLTDTGLGAVDPSRTNVLYFPGGSGPPIRIPRDDSAPCDLGANGWQLTGRDTRVRICGTLCDQIQMDPAARVEIEVGCVAQTCPPDCPDGGMPVDSGMCRPESCANGIDDDCDGLVDELDRDCILF